jgi:DNA replication and repair protein RecF
MLITKLELNNFRNYAHCVFSPEKGINLIVGENAQGKTNLLEAVFFCCFGRSHRTSREKEMIAYDAPSALVRLSCVRTDTSHELLIRLSRDEGRRIKSDGQPLPRIGELMGLLNCVLFAPEHLSIVKEGPAERRRFLDMELSQTHPAYFFLLQQYMRALRQRNMLLRSVREHPDLLPTLPAWNEQLASLGCKIMQYREDFCARLSLLASQNHREISGGRETLLISYRPDCPAPDEGALLDLLSQAQKEDLRRMTTTRGPHRDEMALTLDGREIRAFGSQGQQRTAALSIKLSELDLIRKETGEWPILMLDDVMSELDERRQTYLLERILPVQTLVTATSFASAWPSARKFFITGGAISDSPV